MGDVILNEDNCQIAKPEQAATAFYVTLDLIFLSWRVLILSAMAEMEGKINKLWNIVNSTV